MRSNYFILSLSLLASCVTMQQVNIGTKTSLERQLIGDVEPLTEEELLAASVRADGDVGVGSLDDLQARAISARRRQLFNRDDVDELKSLGCLGEGKNADLLTRDCTLTQEQSALQTRVVDEENADRKAIIQWALEADPALTPSDKPQIVEVYRRLLAERARPRDWLQSDNASWRQK